MAAYVAVKGGKLKLKHDSGSHRKKSSKRKREERENQSGSEPGLLKHGRCHVPIGGRRALLPYHMSHVFLRHCFRKKRT